MNFRTGFNAAIAVTIALAATIPLTILLRSSYPPTARVPYGGIFALALLALALLAFVGLSARDAMLAISRQRAREPASPSVRAEIDSARNAREEVARAYGADAGATRTCAHLQPFERGMRAAGIGMSLSDVPPPFASVDAACTIDLEALGARYGFEPPLTYREYYRPDRSGFDRPTAEIGCMEHPSRIYTLHPRGRGLDSPRFPV